jgi:hypothetical protein
LHDKANESEGTERMAMMSNQTFGQDIVSQSLMNLLNHP